MESFSGIKINELLNQEKNQWNQWILLREKSQCVNATYYATPIVQCSRKGKKYRNDKVSVVGIHSAEKEEGWIDEVQEILKAVKICIIYNTDYYNYYKYIINNIIL